MLIVTTARYRAITGDYDTDDPTVSAKLEEATELLEEALDRPLAETQRTEKLVATRDGYVWPKAVPITNAGGYIVDGYGLRGPFGPIWPDETGRITITYTGGFVERTANPDAANRLPLYMERDIAHAAHTLLAYEPDDDGRSVTPVTFPPGAASVRLGDASVTFGPDGPPRPEDLIQWSRRTLAWRHRTVGGHMW